MPRFRGQRRAFGAPGAEAYWRQGNKDGIGAAYDLGSSVWFSIWNGILTEIHYPTVDQPQTRDVQFLFTHGNGEFFDELSLEHDIARITPTQGYRITTHEKHGRFSYIRELIADPRRAAVLIHTELKGQDSFLKDLRIYLLCNPHMNGNGAINNAHIVEVSGRELLVAEKENRWMIAGVSCGFSKLSCGYVGQSDGYTDLKAHRKMTLEFDEATGGNVALTGELNLNRGREFTISLAFGESLSGASSCLLQSLYGDYNKQRRHFIRGWEDATKCRKGLEAASCDGGDLYRSSFNVVLAHGDKAYQGAFVASLATPWGDVRNDQDGKAGYHLVWTRDLVESALGLLAAGEIEIPRRVLIYLAARQEENGNFPQNFWVTGEAFRRGEQLDEVAFPVLLAARLRSDKLLSAFNPDVLVRRAVTFLLLRGPVTQQERWEENGGYSPSTLAVIICAFICAAGFEREAGNTVCAEFLEAYADFLLDHLTEWTVSSKGYFIRLNPAKAGDVAGPGSVDKVRINLPDQPPGCPAEFPANEIVDAGFLQLVRYGVLAANDRLITKSLEMVDRDLKTELPGGPGWRRYTHDGYGQKPDGGPFAKWGKGRSWPLLTGERAHYELAVGGDHRKLVRAMEACCGPTCLLPEQVWDEADLPEANMRCGGPTGSAVPLVWAHSEYLRLLRSIHDGAVFDVIPEVEERYVKHKCESRFEFWLPRHPIQRARPHRVLRICAPEAFRLHWTADGWKTLQDTESRPTGIGAEYCDLPESAVQAGVEFTFFWISRNAWEGANYNVEVEK